MNHQEEQHFYKLLRLSLGLAQEFFFYPNYGILHIQYIHHFIIKSCKSVGGL